MSIGTKLIQTDREVKEYFHMDIKALGSRLKEARNSVRLNQKALATKMGISVPSVSRYERGERPPPVDYVYDICSITNTNLLWIMTGMGSMSGTGSGSLYSLGESEVLFVELFRSLDTEEKKELINFMEMIKERETEKRKEAIQKIKGTLGKAG